MRIRMTIGRRIGMGFGLFIFFALVVVLLTNRTIENSRSINTQINNVYGPSVDALVRLRLSNGPVENSRTINALSNTVYGPSVDALVRLRNLVVNARTLVKHWALVESIPDAPEKTALVTLTENDLPALIDRIDTLQA